MAHEIFGTAPFDAFAINGIQVGLHKMQIGTAHVVAWKAGEIGRYWELANGVEWGPDIDLFVRDDAIMSLMAADGA
jgi:hypothetical protein